MFCLRRRSSCDAKLKETFKEDDFGWWINNEDSFVSPRSSQNRDCQSLGSSESMLSCIDSDDSECYFLAQEFKDDCNDNCERIELTALIHQDLNVDLIEQDAITKEGGVTSSPRNETKNYLDGTEPNTRKIHGMCYTPERLIKSHEYRILTPSPRYLSIRQPKIVKENENQRKSALRSRRRLNYLADTEQYSETELNCSLRPKTEEMALSTISCHDWETNERMCNGDDTAKDNCGVKLEDKRLNGVDDKKSYGSRVSDNNKKTNCERFNASFEDERTGNRSSFFDDVSSSRSNEWNDSRAPLSLSDELATTDYKLDITQERCTPVNEVVSILEMLDTNPEKAVELLEEDRFCESTSSHDQLTRLALTIESDANVTGIHEHPDNLVKRLQNKIEKLQASSKDIYKDLSNLRKSFQYDEQKMTDISSNANKLLQDVQELRHLDDLLNLLRGELKMISKRNWPFVIGRMEHHSEEMNLIV